MKELSIEEKAKRYDEALAKAVKIHRNYKGRVRAVDVVIEEVFPEFQESEDERIKKSIIEHLKCDIDDMAKSDNAFEYEAEIEELSKYIAWLEKQDEQSNANKEYWRGYREGKQEVLDKYSELKKQGEQKPIIEMKTPEESLGIDSETYSKIVDECIYGEQKPADNVEPKFKVGDWVVNNINKDIFLIKSINNGYCTLEDIKGNIIYPCLPPCESELHLWTIQDAKDGNILVCGKEKRPFIFKGLLDKFHPDNPVVYCGIDCCNEFCITVGNSWWTDEEVEPATKEQRDLLFQKMKEAGYTFDFEKKELNKIDQEQVIYYPDNLSDNWEQVIDYPDNLPKDNWELVHEFVNKFGRIPKDEDELNALVEYVLKRQKPDWSEEDEITKNNISHIIRQYDKISKKENQPCYYVGDCLLWIQNIKDRVQPQLKQEWSENDKKCKNALIGLINEIKNQPLKRLEDWDCYLNWLKSLRPQSTWLPSDEQMEALEYYMHTLVCNEHKEILFGLYADLKKLREE